MAFAFIIFSSGILRGLSAEKLINLLYNRGKIFIPGHKGALKSANEAISLVINIWVNYWLPGLVQDEGRARFSQSLSPAPLSNCFQEFLLLTPLYIYSISIIHLLRRTFVLMCLFLLAANQLFSNFLLFTKSMASGGELFWVLLLQQQESNILYQHGICWWSYY